MEDNFLEQLQQAPPSAPTVADADAAKAAQTAQAANLVANATTSPGKATVPETPAAPASDSPSANPRPGSLAFHLTNALAKTYTDPRTAALATAPGGGTRNLFLAATEALNRQSAPPAPPAPTGAPAKAPAQSGTPLDQIISGDKDNNAPAPRPAPSAAGRIGTDINGALKELGDVGAAPGPGGLFGGFARTAAATSQREAEEMKNRQLMATSNAQMLHEQAATHKLGEDMIKDSITDSKAAMDNIVTAPPGGEAGSIDATGKTAEDLRVMINNGQLDPTKQTAFLTGRTIVGKNPDGTPKFQSTYSVVTPAGDVQISPENAKLLNAELGRKYSTDPDKLQVLPAVQLNHEIQQALSAKVTRRAFELNLAKDDETIRKAQTSADAETIFRNPVVTNAVNAAMSSPGDPFAIVKAYNTIMNNPKLLNDPKMPRNFSEAYIQAAGGTAVWDKKVEEYAKAQQKNVDATDEMLNKVESSPQEIEGHTPAFTAAMKSIISDPNAATDKKVRATRALGIIESTRQLELELEGAKETTKADAKEKASRGTESDKIGPEFLATLPKSRQSLITGIANGQVVASPSALQRTDKGQALLADILQAYPDFDQTKGETWFKTRNEYVGSGPTAKATINYNTALEHLQRVFDTSTFDGLYRPGSKAYSDRSAEMAIVSSEVGKAVKTGVVTEGEADEIRSGLSGWIPSTAREHAAEVSRLLKQKIDQFQEKFNSAAPSAIIQVPTLINSKSQASFDYIQSGGKTPPANVRPANAAPDAQLIQGPSGKQAWLSPQDAAAALQKKGYSKVGQ